MCAPRSMRWRRAMTARPRWRRSRRRRRHRNARDGRGNPIAGRRVSWIAMPLTAIALNCTLKRSSGEDSSTDAMIGLLVSELKKLGVGFAGTIRVADHDVKPGVTSDEGEGDEWPALRARILAADILVFGTPIWLGQLSSLAKRVLERMDAFLSETDDKGRMPS